jgi:hypothetical protein
MPRIKGTVRRSQLITTYGVGAVVAVEDESFIIKGIDQWGIEVPEFHEPRLQRAMGVAGFARPPASDDDPDVPVARFPTWYSCPSCRRLAPHGALTGYQENTCNRCGSVLIPSRFVIACPRGHIADFPYDRWVHAGHGKAGDQHDLSLHTIGNTASLRSIVIECSCGLKTSMDGAFDRAALRGITKCFGQRPWLADDEPKCDEQPRTLQRGASNVWFSATRSALSIPPWSETVFKVIRAQWPALSAVPEAALPATVTGMGLDTRSGFSVDQLVRAIKRARGLEAGDPTDDYGFRREEFEALLNGSPDDQSDEFVCAPGELGTVGSQWFAKVMLATRLREVRALEYFTRLSPPSPATAVEHQAPLFVNEMPWLPAIEVTGEGVFLTLDPDRLARWEKQTSVGLRAKMVDDRYGQAFKSVGRQPDRAITPRLLLVHTLAHVLINQWALESGYPAASLRERLFVFDDAAGLLIYTATSDSAGSLGGVVGQARPERLDPTLSAAAEVAGWCSSDPVCIETIATGVDSLNLAACHACVLLPEVSCEERNGLLDRATLIGEPGNPQTGYLTMT